MSGLDSSEVCNQYSNLVVIVMPRLLTLEKFLPLDLILPTPSRSSGSISESGSIISTIAADGRGRGLGLLMMEETEGSRGTEERSSRNKGLDTQG